MDASTWEAAIERGRSVLIVVNSRPTRRDEIVAALDAVEGASGLASAAAIVPSEMRSWFIRQGLPASRVVASRLHGIDVDLGHFFDSSFAMEWVLRRPCDFVVGTRPYLPLNEETHEDLEPRVARILGGGRYLTHTLPGRELFLFTAEDLLRRAGRRMALQAHAARQHLVLADVHRRWVDLARPSTPAHVPDIAAASAALVPDGGAESAPGSVIGWTAVSTLARLTEATRDLLSRQTAPPIQVSPAGTVPAAGWIPSHVEAIWESQYVADRVKWEGTRLAMRAKAEGAYSYLFVSAGEDLLQGDAIVAAGRVFRGGLTIGLLRNDTWVSRVDVDETGPFMVTVVAREPGEYRLGIANCLRGTESRTAFVLRRFGWTRRKPIGREHVRDCW